MEDFRNFQILLYYASSCTDTRSWTGCGKKERDLRGKREKAEGEIYLGEFYLCSQTGGH